MTVDDVREAIGRVGLPGTLVERETHVSRVFLAGDRAYKLKKAVVFPLLDAGTPGRRRELCREEVRLNRRLAADIYLGVRAVVRTPTGCELADEGAPDALEYLVEMRRYDERETMAARLTRGELRGADVIAVARRLAAFHQDASRVPVTGAASPALERRVLENLHELLSIVEQRAEVEPSSRSSASRTRSSSRTRKDWRHAPGRDASARVTATCGPSTCSSTGTSGSSTAWSSTAGCGRSTWVTTSRSCSWTSSRAGASGSRERW